MKIVLRSWKDSGSHLVYDEIMRETYFIEDILALVTSHRPHSELLVIRDQKRAEIDHISHAISYRDFKKFCKELSLLVISPKFDSVQGLYAE